jgi:putative ABC transport system permease protein
MWSFAVQNILSRPVRTILSVLSLTVAIAGMVGLYSIAGGIDRVVTSTFRLIPGLLVQQRGAPVPIFSSLPAEWESEIEAMPGVAVVNPEIISRVNTINGQPSLTPPRFLVGMEIESRLKLANGVYSEFVKSGRFLDLSDQGTNHAVVSRQIAEEFEIDLGETLEVNGFQLHVVGIYECGTPLLDVNVLCDIDTVRQITRYDPDSVSVFYVEQDGTIDDDTLTRRIEKKFRDRLIGEAAVDLSQFVSPGSGSLLPTSVQGIAQFLAMASTLTGMAGTDPERDESAESDDDEPSAALPDDEAQGPVEVRSADDWSERFQEITADLDLFLGIMTTIGVVIAVISIINTMLMSVAERTIEFGILRANGWSRRDLLTLITAESSLIGVSGGALGAFFGWVATLVLNQIWPDRLHLYATPGLLAFSIVFATILGLIGGLYPAWLAGRMVPMDAIRRG